MSQSPRSSVFRRVWKPLAVTAAGGTASAIWFDEMLLFAEDILALIFLPVMAGVIYLFNILVFNHRLPRRNDLSIKNTGAKK